MTAAATTPAPLTTESVRKIVDDLIRGLFEANTSAHFSGWQVSIKRGTDPEGHDLDWLNKVLKAKAKELKAAGEASFSTRKHGAYVLVKAVR